MKGHSVIFYKKTATAPSLCESFLSALLKAAASLYYVGIKVLFLFSK